MRCPTRIAVLGHDLVAEKAQEAGGGDPAEMIDRRRIEQLLE